MSWYCSLSPFHCSLPVATEKWAWTSEIFVLHRDRECMRTISENLWEKKCKTRLRKLTIARNQIMYAELWAARLVVVPYCTLLNIFCPHNGWLLLLDQSFTEHRWVESYISAIAQREIIQKVKWKFSTGLRDRRSTDCHHIWRESCIGDSLYDKLVKYNIFMKSKMTADAILKIDKVL